MGKKVKSENKRFIFQDQYIQPRKIRIIILPSNHARTHSHSILFNLFTLLSSLKYYAVPTNYFAKKTIIFNSLVFALHYKKSRLIILFLAPRGQSQLLAVVVRRCKLQGPRREKNAGFLQ